jgi:hypothetical protein
LQAKSRRALSRVDSGQDLREGFFLCGEKDALQPLCESVRPEMFGKTNKIFAKNGPILSLTNKTFS